MWQLAAPSLPKTYQQVEEWLFDQTGPKIPVTNRHYQQAKAKRPREAQHFLKPGGDAEVAVAYTACLAQQPPPLLTSESRTSWLVQQFLCTAFAELKSYSHDRLQYSIRVNDSEKDQSHTSSSKRQTVRPGTMVIVSSCTLLLGEDKHATLAAAFQDLQSKRIDLSARLYKDVTFLLGYVAAETNFQWLFLPQLAEQVRFLSPVADHWQCVAELCISGQTPCYCRTMFFKQIDVGNHAICLSVLSGQQARAKISFLDICKGTATAGMIYIPSQAWSTTATFTHISSVCISCLTESLSREERRSRGGAAGSFASLLK